MASGFADGLGWFRLQRVGHPSWVWLDWLEFRLGLCGWVGIGGVGWVRLLREEIRSLRLGRERELGGGPIDWVGEAGELGRRFVRGRTQVTLG